MKPKSGKKVSTVAPTGPAKADDADEADPGKVAETKARERQVQKGKYGSQKVKKYTPPEEEEVELTWIEIELKDRKDNPVPSARFEVTTPDDQTIRGTLDKDGFARLERIKPGTCKISFPEYDKDAWESA